MKRKQNLNRRFAAGTSPVTASQVCSADPESMKKEQEEFEQQICSWDIVCDLNSAGLERIRKGNRILTEDCS